MNALVNIETITAEKLFAPGEVEKLIAKLETDVRAMPKGDISTDAGRDEIRSLAYKIARTKTGLDGLGKEHVAELKKRSGAIDAQRRIICDRLDALKDEVRKPVTEWEDSEKARIEGHDSALAAIRATADGLGLEPSSDLIHERLRSLGTIAQRDWQEYAPQANGALAVAEDALRAALAAAQKREADQIELAKLRAEVAAREERDRKEAAAKAEEERQAKANLLAEEQERARAEQAENDKAAAVAAALEAEQRKRDQEAADAAAKKAAEEAADRKRQENKRHRAKIHREIILALSEVLTGNYDEAAALIEAIDSGRIPHITINY